MQILLSDCGKRYNRDWIFRKFSRTFISGTHYAITGPNGSGKSTLLQVLAGSVMNSEGNITYTVNNNTIDNNNIFRHLSIAAPYQEVIEEMTPIEFFSFHHQFKPLLPIFSIQQIIEIVGLEKSAHKQIRYFSSGMKQRVKLAQAIFSNVDCILLDEPCTNLDSEGINLYHRLIQEYCSSKMIIISSNDPQEYITCTEIINILDYKIADKLPVTGNQ